MLRMLAAMKRNAKHENQQACVATHGLVEKYAAASSIQSNTWAPSTCTRCRLPIRIVCGIAAHQCKSEQSKAVVNEAALLAVARTTRKTFGT